METAQASQGRYGVFSKYPLLFIPVCCVGGTIGYGGVFTVLIWLSGADEPFWMALLFGFFGVILMPQALVTQLTEMQQLVAVFLIHGATVGLLAGLLLAFKVYWDNSRDGSA